MAILSGPLLSGDAFAQPGGGSTLLTAPADPRAVTVKGKGDRRADDTAALQRAVDAARDKTGHGLVFLPSGRYRSLVMPAYRTFQQGSSSFLGWRFSDALDSYGIAAARPGSRVFVSNEPEDKTYSALLGARGQLTDLKTFADRGGESVAVDAQGRVYVADGQVFVHAPDGRALGRIDVPERPLQLIFGGADKRTLYILAHHALYRVRL